MIQNFKLDSKINKIFEKKNYIYIYIYKILIKKLIIRSLLI